MKQLLFAWKIIELLSSTGIASKSLIRSVNPKTYTFYCVYSEERIESNEVAGKHTKTCGSLNCSYYRRILGGGAIYSAGFATQLGGSFFFIEALSAVFAPVTGGLSLVMTAAGVLSPLGLVGTAVAVPFSALAKMIEISESVESELKEKWENEQRNIRIEEEVGESSQSQNNKP